MHFFFNVWKAGAKVTRYESNKTILSETWLHLRSKICQHVQHATLDEATKDHVIFSLLPAVQSGKQFPFGNFELRQTLWERLFVLMLWNMYVIPSKGIPANVTGRDDVATRKYKSTCGEGSGSFCCSVNALCVYVLFTVVCPLYIMATGKQVSDKQRFRLCASHYPRFITGGDTHNLCIACLGAEHARSALEEADCPHCVRISMRSLRFRRALSPVLLAVPLSLRQSGAWNRGDHIWIWQKNWRWACPFLHLPLPDPVLNRWVRKHVLEQFLPPRERARRSCHLPLRRRVARASSEKRLWVCHHSRFRSRSCWRWLPEL